MLRSTEDIAQSIVDAIEPLDLIDRLNISAEQIIDGFDITTEELVEIFKERIMRNLDKFDDIYMDDEEYGC